MEFKNIDNIDTLIKIAEGAGEVMVSLRFPANILDDSIFPNVYGVMQTCIDNLQEEQGAKTIDENGKASLFQKFKEVVAQQFKDLSPVESDNIECNVEMSPNLVALIYHQVQNKKL